MESTAKQKLHSFLRGSGCVSGQILLWPVLFGAFTVTLVLSCSANENFNITHTRAHGHTVKSCDCTHTLWHHTCARFTHISANKPNQGWGFMRKRCTCHLLPWAVSSMDTNGSHLLASACVTRCHCQSLVLCWTAPDRWWVQNIENRRQNPFFRGLMSQKDLKVYLRVLSGRTGLKRVWLCSEKWTSAFPSTVLFNLL